MPRSSLGFLPYAETIIAFPLVLQVTTA
ncbi:MAG: hypothetical protein QOG25_4090, partial [Acetobacteraceae bacterium]|nr:hypothetical protein [Acetobacteraceae bacterium]